MNKGKLRYISSAGGVRMIRPREIQINLLSYKFEKQVARNRIMIECGVYLGVALLLLGMIFLISSGKTKQITNLNAANVSLKAELNLTDAQTTTLLSQEKIQEQITHRNKIVNEVAETKSNFGDVFEQIGEVEVAGILITNIDVKPRTINFKGLATGRSSMVEFMECLSQESGFGDIVNLNYKANEDTGEISFTISMSLEVKSK